MDLDPASPAPRKKGRFVPKAPPRRQSQSTVQTKTEAAVDSAENAAAAEDLLRQFNEKLGNRGPRAEKKSSVRVAFGDGAVSSNVLRTYGKLKEDKGDKSIGSTIKDPSGQIVQFSPSDATTDGIIGSSSNSAVASSLAKKKEYREPWDYHHTYYPTTLPLRRPYAGEPGILNDSEFGDGATKLEYDENSTNSASELGLLEENEDVQMLFLQLPPDLPLDKRVARVSASAKGKEKIGSSVSSKEKEAVGNSIPSGRENASKIGCSLEELPGGYMGKMLVYKSGAVKLKLGENLYDVSPGTRHIFAQDVAAINTVHKECCMLGELGKRAVVTPDIDSFLDNTINLS